MDEKQIKDALNQIAEDGIRDEVDLWDRIKTQIESEQSTHTPKQNGNGKPSAKIIRFPIIQYVGRAVAGTIAFLFFGMIAYAFYQFSPFNQTLDEGLEAVERTELNLTQTQDGITITLEWAYADAHRIAVGYTTVFDMTYFQSAPSVVFFELTDEDGNVIPSAFGGGGGGGGGGDDDEPLLLYGENVASFDASGIEGTPDVLNLRYNIIFQEIPNAMQGDGGGGGGSMPQPTESPNSVQVVTATPIAGGGSMPDPTMLPPTSNPNGVAVVTATPIMGGGGGGSMPVATAVNPNDVQVITATPIAGGGGGGGGSMPDATPMRPTAVNPNDVQVITATPIAGGGGGSMPQPTVAPPTGDGSMPSNELYPFVFSFSVPFISALVIDDIQPATANAITMRIDRLSITPSMTIVTVCYSGVDFEEPMMPYLRIDTGETSIEQGGGSELQEIDGEYCSETGFLESLYLQAGTWTLTVPYLLSPPDFSLENVDAFIAILEENDVVITQNTIDELPEEIPFTYGLMYETPDDSVDFDSIWQLAIRSLSETYDGSWEFTATIPTP